MFYCYKREGKAKSENFLTKWHSFTIYFYAYYVDYFHDPVRNVDLLFIVSVKKAAITETFSLTKPASTGNVWSISFSV